MRRRSNCVDLRRAGFGLAVGLALVVAIGGVGAATPKSDAGPLNPDQRLTQAVRLERGGPQRPTLASEMRRLNVPSVSIAVVRNGSLAWARAYGHVRTGGPAATTNTLFQAASISKTITAVAVLRLVEAGQLDLDRDVNEYLKAWKLPKGSGGPVTLRELLSHTGGVNVGGFPGYPAGAPVPSLLQVLEGTPPSVTVAVRVDSVPGSSWRYSGGGYTIVQQLLTDVTGKTFPDLMKELVLGPTGMRASAFSQPLRQGGQASVATPYSANGRAVEGGPHIYPELAAAGLWTTPTDLALFLIELQRCVAGKGKLLSAAMAREAFKPGLGNWGLGFQVEGSGDSYRFGHPGANEGYRIQFVGYVDRSDGAVIMSNGDGGKTIADEVLRTIASKYGWKGYESSVRAPALLSPRRLDRLTGIYSLANGKTLHIGRNGTHLSAKIEDSPTEVLYSDSTGHFFSISNNIDMHWSDLRKFSGMISVDGLPEQIFLRRQ